VAKKYFGDADPIGKVLVFKDANSSMTVTGLIDAVPEASHFHFGLFASMTSLQEARSDSWMDSNFFTYLVLPKGYDYHKLEARLPQTVDSHIAPQMERALHMTLTQFRQNGSSIGLYLQPLTEIHLHSDLTEDLEPYGDIQYVYIFSVIAVFILLIACINFMNLSTASAAKRSREVGIRKVMGSEKRQLVQQFLSESLLLTAIALVLALAIVWSVLPFFNQLTGQRLKLDLTRTPWLIPGLLLAGLFTGLLAGSYPAFFLSAFNPIAVLKTRGGGDRKSAGLRSGLVVFQFFISICLIIGTAVVYQQLSYIQHKQLGYDRDKVVVVEETYWLGKNLNAFRDQLRQDPRIASVSASEYLPAGPSDNNNFFTYPDDESLRQVKGIRYGVDENYLGTLRMALAAGRNFSRAFGADSSAAIVNETAARAFGWAPDAAVGHTLSRYEGDVKKTWHVVGVVKDFNFRSLHQRITPVVMVLDRMDGTTIVRLRTDDIPGVLASMRKSWGSLTAEAPFSWSFLDERYDQMYKNERHTGILLTIFAGLTIFVACLGLFGLATFTAEQRTKEIGIRKVLGADVKGIVALLAGGFLRLVGLSFLLAAPVAWFFMNKWLQDFAYPVSIGYGVFLLAAGIAFTIALLTISVRAIRAATANPVKSLRTE